MKPFDLELLCEQARVRLRRSIAIRTGIAKKRIAEAFRQSGQADQARERELPQEDSRG